MPAPPVPPEQPAASGPIWNIDRARLLRDATADFLSRGGTDALMAERYEALASGFLPQIKREAAIDIARMLAGCPYLSPGIMDAFATVGIRIKPQGTIKISNPAGMNAPSASMEPPEDSPMSDHRFFAGPLMDKGASTFPATAFSHLDPYQFHAALLDPVQAQALMRAAERRDLEDFSTIIIAALSYQAIIATPASVGRMVRDKTGEPAALLVKALGGDKSLLIKTVQAFARDFASITTTVRHALDYYETIQPERAQQIVALYFGAAIEKKSSTAHHLTVQSGQSLHLRATGTAQKPVVKPSLSQRLAATLKK